MDTALIYELVSELAEAIINCDLYKAYKRCQEDLLTDDGFLTLMHQFQKKKETFEDAKQYGNYHPDLPKARMNYQQAKIELMENKRFTQFKDLEKQVESMVFAIEEALQAVVGISNKHKKSALRFMY